MRTFSTDVLHEAGFTPADYEQFQYAGYSITLLELSIDSGWINRSGADWFDLFVPTRYCLLHEEHGNLPKKRFAYRPGSVGFSPPGAEWRARVDGRVEGVSFFIPTDLMRQIAQSVLGYQPTVWRHVLADAAPAISWLAQDVASQVRLGVDPIKGLRLKLTETLLALLCRHYAKSAARDAVIGVRSPPVIRALAYISKSIASPLSRESIAEAAFVSPSQLGRLFREEIGESVWGHVLRRRAEKYLGLIEKGVSKTEAA
ncbi:MAG: hypothetical protein AAFP97_12300, partial [Pseudomonadota bacterium]